MAASGEEIVRRVIETFNSGESVDDAMSALEPLLDPEIEWVNPDDALEAGTRRGLAGARTVLESLAAGAGSEATVELVEIEGRGHRVFVLTRLHLLGEASGVDAVGPPVASIHTLRDERVLRIEWQTDVDAVRRRFERETRV